MSDTAWEARAWSGHKKTTVVTTADTYSGIRIVAECEDEGEARLIASSREYHDAAFWIRQAVAANAAPVNPLAALEELVIYGEHVTLDAGLVLDLLKAHAKATGEQA